MSRKRVNPSVSRQSTGSAVNIARPVLLQDRRISLGFERRAEQVTGGGAREAVHGPDRVDTD